jgi:hypothetical protein
MKILIAVASLTLFTASAQAGPAPVQTHSVDGLYTQAQIQIEVDRDRGDRDRDGWRRPERREGWREGRRPRCEIIIVRRDDGSVRRIRRCRD